MCNLSGSTRPVQGLPGNCWKVPGHRGRHRCATGVSAGSLTRPPRKPPGRHELRPGRRRDQQHAQDAEHDEDQERRAVQAERPGADAPREPIPDDPLAGAIHPNPLTRTQARKPMFTRQIAGVKCRVRGNVETADGHFALARSPHTAVGHPWLCGVWVHSWYRLRLAAGVRFRAETSPRSAESSTPHGRTLHRRAAGLTSGERGEDNRFEHRRSGIRTDHQ